MEPCGTEMNRHVARVLAMFMICQRTPQKRMMNTIENLLGFVILCLGPQGEDMLLTA